jgi:DNA-binding transcriptional regulator YhcF (GntR family)
MKHPRLPAGAGRSRSREGSHKRPVSWSEIERAILLRIARKEYAPGQQIPTCEALAAEFGANKNTVSKAFRSLADRGYLLTRAGFGTFISKRPVRLTLDGVLNDITGLLALAVQEAKLSGFRQPDFRKLVEDVLTQAYGRAGPRVGFIECNRHDATTISRDLQVALSHPIEPLLIDDVIADPQRFLHEYDILAVNITHLSAVEAALASFLDRQGDAQIFGMNIPIDPESLLRVARLRAGTRVGVVCDLKQTLVSITGMVAACNPALRILGSLTTERARLERLSNGSDVLLVTPSASERIQVADSQVPVVTLTFRPDVHSVDRLSALIDERVPPVVHLNADLRSRRTSAP